MNKILSQQIAFLFSRELANYPFFLQFLKKEVIYHFEF